MMCVTGIATPLKFLTNRFGRSSEAQHRLENEQCVLWTRAVSGLCVAAASPSVGSTHWLLSQRDSGRWQDQCRAVQPEAREGVWATN